MKKYLLLFLVFLSYSQTKEFVPKQGSIVFEKNEIITNTLLYRNSFEKVYDEALPKMKIELLKEIGIKSAKIPDSINQQLNQMLEMMKTLTIQEMFSNKPKNIVKFHHEYHYTVIEEFVSLNGKFLNKINIISADSLHDDLFTITGIQEFKNETKIIKGFKCHKVIMCYFVLNQPPGINSLLNTMELWVTNKIKSRFHPIIKTNEILEKYYPLEINQSIKDVKGVFNSYKIFEFSLK